MLELISDAAAARILDALNALRARLPETHPFGGMDVGIGLLLTAAHIVALLPPPTRAWRLARAALGPFIAGGWVWLGYVPFHPDPHDRWGCNILFLCYAFRALEHLVVFPPEFEVYRLRPLDGLAHTEADGHASDKSTKDVHPIVLVPEPIPAPWTWAKLDWATSLWWSLRGIGWNYAPPATESQTSPPFSRDTPRRQHLAYRAKRLLWVYAVDGLAMSFMHYGMPQFFVARTLQYADLSTGQRAAVSIATVSRIMASLEYAHHFVGMACVMAGGLFGLKGELWEPWGWPSMFGSIKDIWSNPGLNYMWAKAWNQYNRRMYHIWAWVGLGEGILGLPPSGKQLNRRSRSAARPSSASESAPESAPASRSAKLRSRPAPLRQTVFEDVTPPASGESTPTAGMTSGESTPPTGLLLGVSAPSAQIAPATPPASPPPPAVPERRAGLAANLLKSALVFAFSGLHHDSSSVVMLMDALGRGETINPRHVISLGPFFLLQPIAIAAEALLVPFYRSMKRKRGIKRHGEGPLLTLVERTIGFAYVWIWLGWTAQWFVSGMTHLGVWSFIEAAPLPWNAALFVPLWKAIM